jgi:hypothetical protein
MYRWYRMFQNYPKYLTFQWFPMYLLCLNYHWFQ